MFHNFEYRFSAEFFFQISYWEKTIIHENIVETIFLREFYRLYGFIESFIRKKIQLTLESIFFSPLIKTHLRTISNNIILMEQPI